jgi:hypothetical protein
MKRGARVEFSDGLHMKVYWSRSRGCIITSANASSSALAVSGLKEAGTWLPPGVVDIDRLIRYARPRPVRQAELHSLDRRAIEHRTRLEGGGQQGRQAPDFPEWYASPDPSVWKIAWAGDEVSGAAKIAREQTLSEYGRRQPHTWMSVGKGRVRPSDWLLCFLLTERGARSAEWQYVDFVVKVKPKEKRYYYRDRPYHAVQVHPLSKYPLPPFSITPGFRKALSRAIEQYSRERLMEAKTDLPPVRLLRRIAEAMKNG